MDKFPQEGKRPPSPPEEEEPHSLHESKIQDKRRSSSEPSEFFEFLHDFSSEMTNAEDIIFRGKLMPYQNPHPQILKSHSADDASRLSRIHRRGGSSLSAAARSRLATKAEAADIHRNSSKSSAKSEGSSKVKPRWFVMMFGPLKLQPEMDLRDIKSRQVRRNTGRLFAGIDGGGGRSDRRSFWGVDLLKVLSCKNHASVAVTASIGLVPHL
ncbi:hypothetical protein SASPL_128605 [Salvia splendens]|uniref:Uncharacterized protein n=1 Tax=Salvia splendens TaxID=180675 RepID=A0A8X8XDH5_SALSN|nr:uncharacterized protein LOC121752601 [Salvia splendens]KAG6410544.1 hypothetical protein SASPL_128605 [Salvia splendens]